MFSDASGKEFPKLNSIGKSFGTSPNAEASERYKISGVKWKRSKTKRGV